MTSSTAIWNTIVLWIVLIWMEPLFYYTLVINDEKKSLEVNIMSAANILAVYAVLQVCRIHIQIQHGRKRRLFFTTTESLALVLACGLPYVLLRATTRTEDTPAFLIGMTLVLSLFLLRVLGIFILFLKQVVRISSEGAIVTLIIGLFLVFYLLGGHLLGGLWYLSAVWKKMECWTDTKNTELGMVGEAFETGIMEVKDLRKKWLYCFRWGLKNLSNNGISLEVNTSYWQNTFVIFLTVYGTVTFASFVAFMLEICSLLFWLDHLKKGASTASRSEVPRGDCLRRCEWVICLFQVRQRWNRRGDETKTTRDGAVVSSQKARRRATK